MGDYYGYLILGIFAFIFIGISVIVSKKLALLKMLGWRILQGFQSLFHFLKKRCFHRLLREYPTDSLL